MRLWRVMEQQESRSRYAGNAMNRYIRARLSVDVKVGKSFKHSERISKALSHAEPLAGMPNVCLI
jgi:hypothetical protein